MFIWVIHCINIGEEYVMGSCVLSHTVGGIPLLKYIDTSMLRALYNVFSGIFYQKQVIYKKNLYHLIQFILFFLYHIPS